MDEIPSTGVFDGLCVDGVGNVWVARWKDRRVIGYSPKGEIMVMIRTPGAKSPTIPCFGGESWANSPTKRCLGRVSASSSRRLVSLNPQEKTRYLGKCVRGRIARGRPLFHGAIRLRVSLTILCCGLFLIIAARELDAYSQAKISTQCTSSPPVQTWQGTVISKASILVQAICSRSTSDLDQRCARS